MAKRKPVGRAFVPEVPDCPHVELSDLFDWPDAGGRFGTCTTCFSTVKVREDSGDNRPDMLKGAA